MDSSEFFGGPEPAGLERDKDGYGRYLLDATGTGKTPFTRSTTIAKMLDNTAGLEKYEQRKMAKGVASSPALVARAAVTPLDDRQAWREILDQAATLSGGDEKRDLGSAFHTFHEHVHEMSDEEYAAVPVELRVTYERYRAELARLGIEEVMTEVTCANTQIGVAGKFDAIFRLADGRLVIGDRKTGRLAEYPHAPCVQLATYANADVLIDYDESGATVRYPMPDVDKTIALAVDITIGDENTAAVHVYELDIWSGWASALLSVKIRAWRNRRDLITPYHPEFSTGQTPNPVIGTTHEPPAALAQALGMAPGTGVPPSHAAGPALPENQAWFEQNTPGQPQPVEPADRPAANTANDRDLGGGMVQPPHAAHPITKQAWSSAEQRNITLNPDGSRSDGLTGPEVSAMLQPDESNGLTKLREVSNQLDADALLDAFKTKAQLQGVLSKVAGPGANLARQRKNLAADIVAHPSWPDRRAEFLTNSGVSAETPLPGRDEPETFSSTVSNAPGPVPPDPEPGFTMYPNGGTDPYDQGSEDPASVDYAATNPFAPPPESPAAPTEDDVLILIGHASTMGDLAVCWQTANDAGIGWPPRLHQAATIRQKQIDTTAPAAQ